MYIHICLLFQDFEHLQVDNLKLVQVISVSLIILNVIKVSLMSFKDCGSVLIVLCLENGTWATATCDPKGSYISERMFKYMSLL